MKVGIYGATGQVGKLTVEQLKLHASYTPVAFIRRPEQASLFDDSIETRTIGIADASVAELSQALTGIDAVVFTACANHEADTAGVDMIAVNLDAVARTIDACKAVGVSRYILVSSIKVAQREFWWQNLPPPIKYDYITKFHADNVLRASNLDYTILQPSFLTNEEPLETIISPSELGSREIKWEDAPKYTIPRWDVAACIVECLDNKSTWYSTIPLSSGEAPITSIAQ